MPIHALARKVRDGSPRLNRGVTGLARRGAAYAERVRDWLELHAVRQGEVTCELPNGRRFRLVAGPGDGVAKLVWWHGWSGYEPELTGIWYRYATRGGVVLDIGANSGLFALIAAHASDSAMVYAFEPIPETFESLRRNVSANAAVNVKAVRLCLGDAEGEATMFTGHGHNDLMASLASDHPGRGRDEQLDSVVVPMSTVDAFVRGRGLTSVDLVKIDVETAEPRVLAGMAETLRDHRPVLVIEVLTEAVAAAVDACASDHGYRRFVLTDRAPVETPHVRHYEEFTNLLLVPGNTASVPPGRDLE